MASKRRTLALAIGLAMLAGASRAAAGTLASGPLLIDSTHVYDCAVYNVSTKPLHIVSTVYNQTQVVQTFDCGMVQPNAYCSNGNNLQSNSDFLICKVEVDGSAKKVRATFGRRSTSGSYTEAVLELH